MSANPGPHSWPPTWFTRFLARDSRASASVFVIEAWVGKRWRPIAHSDYEASARRLFNQVSHALVATSPRIGRSVFAPIGRILPSSNFNVMM